MSDPERPGAREEARRLQTLIDQGIDPRQRKADRIAEAEAKREEIRRRDVTVADAWKEYIEDRRDQWGARHLLDHERLAHPGGEKKKRGKGLTKPGALAAIMPLKLEEVTEDRVKAWLKDEKKQRATQARMAFGALRALLGWCADHKEYRDLVKVEACAPKIAKRVLPKKGVKADCLLAEQLAAWFGEVRKLSNPVIAAYLQALLLTGARREELATLTWEGVDFQWKSLTIRDKVEGSRTIPLTPYVASLLSALPRRNEWVFSSPAARSGRASSSPMRRMPILFSASMSACSLSM